MGEHLIKPYEISVWEDELTQSGFIEHKLAVIGSDTMTGLNKVYEPIFTKKTNGEKTLTFSLKYKYFDPYSGNENIINPFAALLTNERKVKLHYNNQWYEFIVKDHTESSDEYTWTYTCTDAFVLELSKNGYNITFDSELNNNQGTARDLTKKVLENTDWRLGGCDNLKQFVKEPIYKATIIGSFNAYNVDTHEIESCSGDIYVFYSYIKNQNGKFVQFIKRNSSTEFIIDDKNVITATNYRILEDLIVTDTSITGNTVSITLGEIDSLYQANRLVYNQQITYDPITQRTVDCFTVGEGGREVYRYIDYTYTTSNVVMNFMANGDDFNLFEDGSLQGWSPYVNSTNNSSIQRLELITNPELEPGKMLADLETLSQIEGFLKVNFIGALTSDYRNAIFNDGIQGNTTFINSISQGDEFVFRWRAGSGTITNLQPVQTLGIIIAKYTQNDIQHNGKYYYCIDRNNIIFDIKGTPTELNNIIDNGYIDTSGDIDTYIIDGIVQTPSTKFLYKNNDEQDNTLYYWDGSIGHFKPKDEHFLPYYYLTGKAKKSISNTELTDPSINYGIFVYTTAQITPVYIQDIQLTRCIYDNNSQPILIGNVPTATANAKEYYYLKPTDGTAVEDIQTYTTIEDLQEALDTTKDIIPIYNEDCEKYLSISVSKSNCFNALQTIAETFECWIDLVVEHDDSGAITINEEGQLNKFVYLREYVGKENWAGFKYGINLQSIERNINSEEIVTKLIVDQSQSDYVDEGYISIAKSPSNPNGESYILNFDYYYNQGLLNREQTEEDKTAFISAVKDINLQLQEKEELRHYLENSLVGLGSKRNVYNSLVNNAKKMQTEALNDFEYFTNETYEDYKDWYNQHLNEEDSLLEEENVLDTIGKLYTSSAAINNYSGLLSNIDSEYWNVRKELRGSENYKVSIWVDRDELDSRHVFIEVNDYLSGFSFVLGEDTYEVTLSQKYFDITSNATSIVFTAPAGYSVEEPTYIINDNKTVTFKITSDVTIYGVEDDIEELLNQKEVLVNEFNNKYSRFIQEGTWSSTDYIDSDLYYFDALQISNTSAQPIVSYTINTVEVSPLEGYELYSFDTGDKTYVEDTEFFGWANRNGILTPAREEVIVSEVEWHLDEPDQSIITVQNYKTRFEDLFQRISAAVQTVQYNEATYAKISSFIDSDGTINQDVLIESLNRIAGERHNLTSDGSVLIDKDNILIQNLNNTQNRVIINSEGIRISSDGGLTWDTAIDGRGINIGTVYTGKLNTDLVVIGNENNPSFRWDKSGISAYKSNQDDTYDLQTYVRYDQYGLYGIKEGGSFKARNLQDVLNKAHFAVTWDGFFIRNNYTDGRVEITSDNDFRVIQTLAGNDHERIKIGALEFDQSGNPIKYGININQTVYDYDSGQYIDIPAFTTGSDGNVTITGTINATAGNFSGIVNVGPENQDHIIIDGRSGINTPSIASSNYQDGVGAGWMINKNGDAVFNNITARGAIKTAVFEYAEIQAVGGVFIFRPSSTIRSAAIDGNDLILKVEKPLLFKDGDWCKVSNYANGNNTEGGEATNPDINSILANNGLLHVYQVSRVAGSNEIRLLDAKDMINGGAAVVNSASDLIGGALVDMGNTLGTSNYGIGINSSDNTVNLPRRAISLFETEINGNDLSGIKVTYKYQAVLGTLPVLQYSGQDAQVSSLYNRNLAETQGIFTNNIYIGDKSSYLAFYTDKDDNNKKKLRITGADIYFTYDDGQGGTTEKSLDDRIDEIETEGGEGIVLTITSSKGFIFNTSIINTILTAHVYQNGIEIGSSNYSDITALGYQINWYNNGILDSNNSNSKTYQVSGNDLINITAKLEDISN